ncbi:uncharacterized protein LOC134259395 [Saccostrea cucullata]|uniref:uncharacterized protein LOC134259395 n=1 Tax=Saccostrea cuccullata TaxID=36930 RepID=UPI002ED461AE
MYSMWIQFCLYDFGQMAVIVTALCLLVFFLLKRTRDYQLFSTTRNVNKTTSSKYKSTPETTNLARVARLILGPCTDLLRDILRRKIPPSNLSKTVKTWIDDLKKKKQNSPLNKQQIDLIFPLPNKQYGGDYSDFDITLLYILLRNVCKITPHIQGWGEIPDPSDKSLSANTERIRLSRNKYYGHAADFSLSDSDFKREWQNIYNITVELEQNLGTSTVYQDAVNDIKTCSMDPEIEAKYIDKLLLIDELCKTVKSHTDKIEELQYVIPPNVKDLHERQLKQWREEDKVYSETHNFQEMLNKVRRQPYMTFVGVQGSGKSSTIHHIALILQKEEYEVVPIIDIRKIEDYSDSRHPQVFVIDDVVGVLGLQKQKLELLIDYEKRISDPSNRNTKVLMSCREAVFNECYKSFFFSNEKNTIKMHSSDNALNDEDKKAILQKHGLERDLLSPALLGETLGMFPLLCKLYSKGKKFSNNVERFFTCPAECILEQFNEMQRQNSLCYATLVLCMLNDNKLSKETLKNTGNNVFREMKSKVLDSCEVESYTDTFKFVKALAAMEGTYTKLCGTEYTFIHDSLFENLAYHFGSQFPDLVLQYISSNYIANNVKVQECKKESKVEDNHHENEKISCEEHETLKCERSQDSFDLCLRLREDQYPMLAERLYRDIENMELYDVFMNDVLKHPRICQAFIEVLKTKSYKELKSLFLSEQKDVSKVVSKVADGLSLEWRRQNVLLNVRVTRSNPYCVRVISWVVYYGHTPILQYILKQTDLHKETEIELFRNVFCSKVIYEAQMSGFNNKIDNATDKSCLWNSISNTRNQKQIVSEQDRLFLLSCYSGDLEIVRLLIKYVDIQNINNNTQCIFYNTPLTAACEGGHMSVVKELLEAGSDINQKGKYDSPLTVACEGGHFSLVMELIEAGADINQQGGYDNNTPLTAACEGGYVRIVKELIEKGADINQQGEYNTPLTAACMFGYMSVAKELIKGGADVNQQGKYHTPLTAACEGGYLRVVKELIEAGADINPQDGYNTPLTAACEGGYLSVVKELIEAGADINKQNKYNTPLIATCGNEHVSIEKDLIEAGAIIGHQENYNAPLTAACEGGHISVVKELIEAGAEINQQGKNDTPLIAACKGGHISVVKKLIEEGADINLQGVFDTPLTAACENGYIGVVKELIEAGADINQQGENDTPLIAACEGGHMSVVKELIEAGADINQQDYIDTSLIVACKIGDVSVVKVLIEVGANINQQNWCNTPLTAACQGGHISVLKELIEAGADINQDGEYDTPLTASCKGGHISVVKELIEAGADVNLQSKIDTPLKAACRIGHIVVVKELIDAGADINAQSEDDTPLIAACEGGYMNIVKVLIEAGADVNQQGEFDTPLTVTCEGGYMSVVKELIEAGADVNQQGVINTPLTAAYEGGHISVVKELLNAGADTNQKGKFDTPVTATCKE